MSATSLTLYELTDELAAHAESLEMTAENSPERAECEMAIARYMEQLPAKVDRVAAFMRHLEGQADEAKKEIDRLTARRNRFLAVYEHLEHYVLRVLQSLPEPARGSRKLEGKFSTFSLRASEAISVTDEASVPLDYKTAVVEMPGPVWERVAVNCPWVIESLTKQGLKVRAVDLKAALKAGFAVPGADIEYRQNVRLT